MEPKKYRKRPVVIEAIRFDGGPANASGIIDWVTDNDGTATWTVVHEGSAGPDGKGYDPEPECIRINTLEGTMRANVGDWVIRGVQGEFYPCKPDIFAETYEAA